MVMDLKSLLIELNDMTEEQILNQNLDELISDMLTDIGTIDSDLRELVYSAFAKLISENYLDKRQLQYIMETCLDHNHLFYKIGEINSDSVFTRSFSSLVIAVILNKDKDDRFLSTDILLRAFESSISYLRQEKDTRGYVEGKGWAHSIAHGADLLASAIDHPSYNTGMSKDFLDTVHNCLFKGPVYTDNEDERLIFVIESLMDKDLKETELVEWVINIFSELEAVFEKESSYINFYRIKTNVMNFVKTLYFRLGYKNIGHHARNTIKENLEIWFKKYYIK
ncbi:DUF2785 domain-containing protein [Cytobacillus dafuensis]|uniref:DUF2785 domain-containing protein n=2 Tax=Cytobacillus dafuensis TaxID=1742359 RepID=A0A5B8Z8X9_CYTDA|nr:DUF2785 domain-containing protein [Cytobacillus dafuensis]